MTEDEATRTHPNKKRTKKALRQTRLPDNLRVKQKIKQQATITETEEKKAVFNKVIKNDGQTTLCDWIKTPMKEYDDSNSHEEAGDVILSPSKTILRCVLQNVRGIGPRIKDKTAHTGLVEMKANRVGIFQYPETNLNWSNKTPGRTMPTGRPNSRSS